MQCWTGWLLRLAIFGDWWVRFAQLLLGYLLALSAIYESNKSGQPSSWLPRSSCSAIVAHIFLGGPLLDRTGDSSSAWPSCVRGQVAAQTALYWHVVRIRNQVCCARLRRGVNVASATTDAESLSRCCKSVANPLLHFPSTVCKPFAIQLMLL